MKGSLKNKIFAIMLSALLVAGMSPATFASNEDELRLLDNNIRIRVETTYAELEAGEKKFILIDYDDFYELEESINIYKAYVVSHDPKVVTAEFGDKGADVYTLELTGVSNGKAAVNIHLGKYSTQITVVVGKGKSSSSSSNSSKTASSGKNALEKALDSAIAKSSQKDVTISTTASKTATIAPATLKSLASAAEKANKRAIVRIDSLNSNGKLQARLYLDPASLANLKSDFKTAVSVNTSRKASLGSKYIASVKCAYTGGFGKYTEIAVKVNAPQDVSKLSFYNVDTKGNFKKIAKPSYSFDKSGVLHFFTKNGGEIVIMAGAL